MHFSTPPLRQGGRFRTADRRYVEIRGCTVSRHARPIPESVHEPFLLPLDQQVVVITGASSGIGLVTAKAAARRGARVVLAARNASALDSVREDIVTAGGNAITVVTDVGDKAQIDHLAARAVEAFGRFDTWVNNAGVSIFGMIDEVSIEDMHRAFDTRLLRHRLRLPGRG